MKQNLEPNPHVLCDFPNCNNESTTEITRLACFHTCHLVCLERNGNSCHICKYLFLKRITDLSETFNKGLLENNTTNTCPDINEDQEASQPEISTTRNADFYKSHDWEDMVNNSLDQLVIPQPSVPHRAASAQESSHTETRSSTPNSRQNHCSHCGQLGHRRSRGSRITRPILLRSNNQSQQTTQSSVQQPSGNLRVPLSSQVSTLHVPPSTADMVTFWELPAFLSQSTIGGRQGSNACTIISHVTGQDIHNKQTLTSSEH